MIKSQSKKNIVLLIVWLALVGGSIVAFIYNPYERKTTSFEKGLFSIQNPQQQIAKIELRGKEIDNTIESADKYWTVNEEYRLDASMQQVFFKLLEQISIQRPVTGNEVELIRENVLDTGIQVKIHGEKQVLRSFTVGGDFQAMKSYFVDGEDVYLMQLPGYQSYVAGIFEVSESDWRDRVIFDGIWQDMVSLTIDRPQRDQKVFKYQDKLIRLQNEESDSAKVMDFVERFNYFFVDQFLPKDHLALEKKESFSEAGKIVIEALDQDKSLKLELFKNPDFNAYLVKINDEEWAAIRNERMEKLWIELEKL